MTRRTTTWTLFAGGPDGIPVEVERKRVRRLNLRVRADGSAHLSVPRTLPARGGAALPGRARGLAARLRPSPGGARRRARRRPRPALGRARAAACRSRLRRALPHRAGGEACPRSPHAWRPRSGCTRAAGSCARCPRAGARARRAPHASASTFVWRPTRPPALTMSVAHELTHLLEPSHSERFHALLAGAYPDDARRPRPAAPPPRVSSPPIRAQPLTPMKQTLGRLPSTVSERMPSMSRLAHIARSWRPGRGRRWRVVVDKDDSPLGLTRPLTHT